MKRLLYIPLGLLVLALLIFCLLPRTNVPDGEVTLVFIYGDQDIRATLSPEESAQVVEFLDGRICDPLPREPACGFSENVSLQIDGQTYAIAGDLCNFVMELDTGRYFPLPEEDAAYIRTLFTQYGGFFPCV